MNEFGAILELRRQRQARGFGAYGSWLSSAAHAVTGAVSTVGRAAIGTAVATVAMPTTLLARGAAAIGVPGARQVASIGGAVTGIATGQVPVIGRSVSAGFMPRGPATVAPSAPSWQPATPSAPPPAPPRYTAPEQPTTPSPMLTNDTPYFNPNQVNATNPLTPMQIAPPTSQTPAQTAVETIEPTPGVAPTPAAADAVAPKSSGGAILAGAGAGFVVGGPIGAVAGGVIAHFMTKKA